MLVYTMTPQEAKAEWDKDNNMLMPKQDKEWYKRVGKALKGVTKYPMFFRHERVTKRGTERFMLVRFDSWSDYVNGRNVRVEYAIVPNPKGYRVYIKNYFSDCLIIYSNHSIDRYIERLKLKERGIEAIHKMMKDNLDIKNMRPFELKGRLIHRATHGMFFGEKLQDDIIIWTTFVDNKRLFENQEEDKELMEVGNIDLAKELRAEYKKYEKYL